MEEENPFGNFDDDLLPITRPTESTKAQNADGKESEEELKHQRFLQKQQSKAQKEAKRLEVQARESPLDKFSSTVLLPSQIEFYQARNRREEKERTRARIKDNIEKKKEKAKNGVSEAEDVPEGLEEFESKISLSNNLVGEDLHSAGASSSKKSQNHDGEGDEEDDGEENGEGEVFPSKRYNHAKKGYIDEPQFHEDDFGWENVVGKATEVLKKHEGKRIAEDLVAEYEAKARDFWDLHYKHHTTNHFPVKNYIFRAFTELDDPESEKTVLECGSGAGACLFPIKRRNPRWNYYAFDFSPRAIEMLKENELYSPESTHPFVWDPVTEECPELLPLGTFDYVLAVFVLSAVSPQMMPVFLERIRKCLKPGGMVLLRDHGLFDMAQLRFPAGRQIADNFYLRGDGTRAFYFSKEFTEQLFTSAGFEVVEMDYHLNRLVNQKRKVEMNRIFISGKFRVPLQPKPEGPIQ